MRKFGIVSVFILSCFIGNTGLYAATTRGSLNVNTTSVSGTNARSARSATPAVASRSVGRSATTPATTAGRVASRSATTQKVINTGTKISTANANIVVSDECRAKYYGCMDSFCMLDNTSGGRCLCSDKNADLDIILNEISKLDEQTYAMATTGVELIEMGENANSIIDSANAIANKVTNDNSAKSRRQALDTISWNTFVDFDSDEEEAQQSDVLEGKTGNDLHNAVYGLCVAQMPECSNQFSMLRLMYSQQIRSDCNAYENSLKQQKIASAQKLSAAQSAMREAALEQYQQANKYDLGQCVLEYKKCMTTTAGCGADFSSCATVSAMENTSAGVKKGKTYSIKRDKTKIDISATTYDTILAKKPICDTVTKSCVAVKDQVWDAFLQDVAPQLKSAELIAEDNIRQNCIGTISDCFQKACKDNIDPNDPDGSYDICLTRPETMLSFCKIPLQSCGIDTKNADTAAKSKIWDFVVARLASMRVDSCTTQVKECLQSPDRCGKDYTQCVGLDLASIKKICPTDKLVGCQKDGNAVSLENPESWLDSLLQGIFLSIDNSLLAECQNIVNEKMIEVCGDTTTCSAFDTDDTLGTESLRSTKDEAGNFVISGLISFGNVKVDKIDENNSSRYTIDIEDYLDNVQINDDNEDSGQTVGMTTAKVMAESALETVSSKIEQTIALLTQDPMVQMCVDGRDMSNIRASGGKAKEPYPHLLDTAILTIMNSGLDKARINYTKKYNELVAGAVEEQNDQIKSVMCASMVMGNNDGMIGDYLNGLFNKPENNPYSTEYVIAGADVKNLIKVQLSGVNEYKLTQEIEGKEIELATVKEEAFYSSKDNVCTIRTTTMRCNEVDKIYNTDKVKKNGKVKQKDFKGVICKEYSDPVVSMDEIKM